MLTPASALVPLRKGFYATTQRCDLQTDAYRPKPTARWTSRQPWRRACSGGSPCRAWASLPTTLQHLHALGGGPASWSAVTRPHA